MSAETNQKIALRFFEELCNQRRYDLAGDILAADYVYHDPQVPDVVGPEAMAGVAQVYADGVEGHWRVDKVTGGEDGMVTVLWTGQGKYTGAMPGVPVPPNGNAVEVSAISLLRVADGKVAEQWCVWDTLGFMQQIGAMPSAPSA